ncbi:Stromal membrane-associated protein 1-like [Oopsacas minuta]|uniref:Stromal membrane-associated protein 1-like n=1 Tax=Oopsacas minuta TaxID=111878 RepID=A0AAV7JBR5_9METZ|nr:Stromal membrane-associated protein 1-like [Oopsacas minuta]
MHRSNNGQADPLKQMVAEAMLLSDNKLCQECHCRGPHTWTSWNLGVFLCMRCAGIHRKLGVHISKVKSCTLDHWQSYQVDSLVSKGNKQSWLYYEHNLPEGYVRPNDTSSLEVFIRNKYERKLYNPRDGSVRPPGEQVRSSTPPPEVKKSPPVTKEEPKVVEKKSDKKIEETKSSLTIPSVPSRPRSQPSSPVTLQSKRSDENSLLLDIGTGITTSRSESDFAFLDVEKLFTSNTSSKLGTHPSNSLPLVQSTESPGIDFLEPLVASSNLQMDTNQIISLYQVRAQTSAIRTGPNYQPRFCAPQPQYYQPNASAYRQQQQKMVNDAADIQKTLNAMKTPSGWIMQPTTAANGTESNDPWDKTLANGTQSQPGQTLSQDLWL